MSNDCAGLPRIALGSGTVPGDGQRFLLNGPLGLIEALVDHPKAPGDVNAMAVVCHPHSLHGGTMTNKVVHTVAKTLVTMGAPTLRFNFRGAGCSQGEFDHGRGELDDLSATVAYMREWYPGRSLWLAGFSFGAFVAYLGHHADGAARLLLVAPPVRMFNFSGQVGVKIPWLVVQGGQDDITEPEKVAGWVGQQSNPPKLEWLADAGHFFHGHLPQLRDAIRASWP